MSSASQHLALSSSDELGKPKAELSIHGARANTHPVKAMGAPFMDIEATWSKNPTTYIALA